jgi:hypothetical protein
LKVKSPGSNDLISLYRNALVFLQRTALVLCVFYQNTGVAQYVRIPEMEFLDRNSTCWLIKMAADRFVLAALSMRRVIYRIAGMQLKTGNITSSLYKTIQEPSTCRILQYELWLTELSNFDRLNVIRQVSEDCQLVVTRFLLKVGKDSCIFLSFNSLIQELSFLLENINT